MSTDEDLGKEKEIRFGVGNKRDNTGKMHVCGLYETAIGKSVWFLEVFPGLRKAGKYTNDIRDDVTCRISLH